MKRLNKIGFLSILFSVFLFASCEQYPNENDYVVEQLAAITNYDTNVNFSTYKTYSIADSVTYIDVDVQGNKKVQKMAIAGNPQLQAVYDQVKKDMDALKFTFTAKANNPQLGINLVAAKTATVVVSNPWWWWDYPCAWDWWDCGYYPPYPYYPYPYVVGSYNVGTLSINMADLTVKPTTRGTSVSVPILWVGTIRSLLTQSNSTSDIQNAVDDCFNQTLAFKNLK